MTDQPTHGTAEGIAIIGMAGRFPNAPDLDAFWALIRDGREGLTRFDEAQLRAAGADPALLADPRFVPVDAVIPEADRFDAAFFDIGTRDAEVTDPQQRLFLECAWHALEVAGHPPGTGTTRVGVYAGVGESSYQQNVLAPHLEALLAALGAYRLATVNGKDFIATRTAYLLGLTGPALTVQTACSTSLVAVHVACQALLALECDLALAGGSSIGFPTVPGYHYQEGMILSPDGHCRSFAADAQGTTPGAGVGVVALKRLDEALADGDPIQAIILGSAINNDGADKVGYTAPSVNGQAEVIAEALAVAGVAPRAVSYLEAHGTATPLGDPIEIEALTKVYQTPDEHRAWCALGSVKSNIGHADTAAGIAGLIKTVLALQHRQLPPTLHCATPNPVIDAASPFFVNTRLRPWQTPADQPRTAGVSAFGIGGTNAHVILREAPAPESSSKPSRPLELLTLSAKTPTALDTATTNLAAWLAERPDAALADVAYTLARGRSAFGHRRSLVAVDGADACVQLAAPSGLITTPAMERPPRLAFLFPGQGSQYLGMTRGLYARTGPFRDAMDDLAQRLEPHLGVDCRTLLYGDDTAANRARLVETRFTQPLLFAVEYALAQQWLAWGVTPTAMAGHSLGEYVAACLAGVFSLDEALALVTARGALLQSLPPGAMLSVACSEAEASRWLNDEVALAAVNAPARCTLSGSPAAIAVIETDLKARGYASQRLTTSHAFHSPLVTPILQAFAARIALVKLKEPRIPYLSNVTGTWIRPQEAVDPAYWTRHLRAPVRFADNLATLIDQGEMQLLEVGPGQGLSTLARQHPAASPALATLATLPRSRETTPTAEWRVLLGSFGQLWAGGATVDWGGYYDSERRRRLPLPLYPFERRRYWLDAPAAETTDRAAPTVATMDVKASTEQISAALEPSPTDASLSAREAVIIEFWSQSLGGVIDRDTDFFAAGGDSLLATQLVARLAERFGVNLDAHILLEATTVARLATRIDALTTPLRSLPTQTTDRSELVVEIQAGTPGRPPLVLMHPVGGHVYFYRDTARHIDPQLPVYGIRAQGLHGEAQPLTSISEMAEVYSAALRTLQPTGPYHLAGSSFGGTLAYAMAQRLLAEGETIAYLGLIDTPSENNMPEELEDEAHILHYMLTAGQDSTIALKTLRALDRDARFALFAQQTQRPDTPAARADLARMLRIFAINMTAMEDYVPPPYPGKLHFFLARERDAINAQTPAYGWIPLAKGGIEIHTVPGTHISMNEAPHVAQLGARIRETMALSPLPGASSCPAPMDDQADVEAADKADDRC